MTLRVVSARPKYPGSSSGGVAEGVARLADRGEKHPGVLHSPVGIKQQRPDHPDLGPLHLLQQRVEPAGVDDFDVVVEEQQVFALGLGRGEVVEARPVERSRGSR